PEPEPDDDAYVDISDLPAPKGNDILWAPQILPIAYPLLDLWVSDTYDVYVVGHSGAIFEYTEGGFLWQRKSSGTTKELNAIWGSSDKDIYVVGAEGMILHSSDGGF